MANIRSDAKSNLVPARTHRLKQFYTSETIQFMILRLSALHFLDVLMTNFDVWKIQIAHKNRNWARTRKIFNQIVLISQYSGNIIYAKKYSRVYMNPTFEATFF